MGVSCRWEEVGARRSHYQDINCMGVLESSTFFLSIYTRTRFFAFFFSMVYTVRLWTSYIPFL